VEAGVVLALEEGWAEVLRALCVICTCGVVVDDLVPRLVLAFFAGISSMEDSSWMESRLMSPSTSDGMDWTLGSSSNDSSGDGARFFVVFLEVGFEDPSSAGFGFGFADGFRTFFGIISSNASSTISSFIRD